MAEVCSMKHDAIQKVPASNPDSTSNSGQRFTNTCRSLNIRDRTNVIREPCVSARESVSNFDLNSTCAYSSLGTGFIPGYPLSNKPERGPFANESTSCDSGKCKWCEEFTSLHLGNGESFSDEESKKSGDLKFAFEGTELSSLEISSYSSTIAAKVKDFKRRDNSYSDSECSKSRRQRVKCNGYTLVRKKYKKKPKLSGKSFKAVFGFEADRCSDDSWSRIMRRRRMTYDMNFDDLEKNPKKFIKGCLLAKSRSLFQDTGFESDELFGYGDVFGNYRRYSDRLRQYIIQECEKFSKSYTGEKSEGIEGYGSQDTSDTEQSNRSQRQFKTDHVNDEAKPVVCSDATSTCFQEHSVIIKDEPIVVKMGYELPETLDDLPTRYNDTSKIPLIRHSNIEEINPRLSVFERYLGITQEYLRFQRYERRKEGLKGMRKAYGPRKRKLPNNSDSYSGESESEFCEEFESFSDA